MAMNDSTKFGFHSCHISYISTNYDTNIGKMLCCHFSEMYLKMLQLKTRCHFTTHTLKHSKVCVHKIYCINMCSRTSLAILSIKIMQNEKIIKLVHTDLVCYIHNEIQFLYKQEYVNYECELKQC